MRDQQRERDRDKEGETDRPCWRAMKRRRKKKSEEASVERKKNNDERGSRGRDQTTWSQNTAGSR